MKFAAPILILALIFASCDDRGSTPSGGSSSSLVAEISLGEARSDYPTSGWQVMFEGRSASNETVYHTASKVEYTAAADENPAFLTVTGIPSDKSVYLTGNAYVMFTSGIAGVQIGNAALSSNPSGISDGEVEEFSSAAPATISLTVSAPEGSTVSLPTDPKSYPLVLTGGDETYTLYPEAPTAAKAEAPAQMTLTYTASYSPADGVTLPIGILSNTTSFTGTLSMAIGETPAGLPNYQAAGISLTGLSAGATVKSATTLTELYYGSIVVSLPAALNGEDADDANPAYSYTTVSYVLKSGDTVVAENDAASVSKGETAPQLTIPNIQTGTSGMSLSVSLSVADSKLNRSVVYLGSASSVSGPTEAEGTVSPAQAEIKAFYAQLNSIEVTLTDGPTGYWLSSPEAYSVSYIEVAEDGSDLAGAVSVNVPVTSEMASGIATGQKLTISSVDAGASYKVSVSVKTAYNAYKGATESAVNVAAVTQASPTAVQATIGLVAVEGSGSLPKPTEVKVQGNESITVTGISNAAVESGELTLPLSGISALSGATGEENLEFTLSSASEATMTEATLQVPNTALSSLNSLTWTGSAELGSASVKEVAITGEYKEGTLTISEIAVTGTVDVTFAGQTSAAITGLTGTAGTLTLDSSEIAEPTGLSGDITVTIGAETKGTFSGTVTVPLSATLGSSLTWEGSAQVSGGDEQTATKLEITGSQSETTYTVTAATATVQGA